MTAAAEGASRRRRRLEAAPVPVPTGMTMTRAGLCTHGNIDSCVMRGGFRWHAFLIKHVKVMRCEYNCEGVNIVHR